MEKIEIGGETVSLDGWERVSIKNIKAEGWQVGQLIDSCGEGHWVVTYTHPDHPGIVVVEDCCDHNSGFVRKGRALDWHCPPLID